MCTADPRNCATFSRVISLANGMFSGAPFALRPVTRLGRRGSADRQRARGGGSMATGSYDSDTARKEQLLEEGRRASRWRRTRPCGPCCSSAGSSATPTAPSPGPVIAWMIQNKAGFIGDAANPATLGGLVGLDVLPRLHAHPVPGRPAGRPVRAPRDDHRLAAGRMRADRRLRADGRPRRLRRRPRAHRPRRGRLLLERPHADHQPHAGREADARARHRDRRPVDRLDRRHHLHADLDRLGSVAGHGRRGVADAVLRLRRVHLRRRRDRLRVLPRRSWAARCGSARRSCGCSCSRRRPSS